ncbi:MAG: glycosyltransferase family 2 protein [Thaumarchaeota archaeon]|nr:MAG: glycosyltransferase family 2 protein [Nitrososphaerota archaeon]
MNSPKYSILITNYNTVDTIEESLRSILNQIDERFEVIVVDNASTDGSQDYLYKMEYLNKIRLFTESCSRGQGRQIALDKSWGDYIIAYFDMDDVYKPRLKEFVDLYHKSYEGKILGAKVLMAPRTFAIRIGWHDLKEREDVDFWLRASSRYNIARLPEDFLVKYRGVTNYPLVKSIKKRLIKYIEGYRLGLKQSLLIDPRIQPKLWKSIGIAGLLGISWLIVRFIGKFYWVSIINPKAFDEVRQYDYKRIRWEKQ